MSDASSAAAADALVRVRKERVHTTMLIELLALLVFLAMGFAFLSREERDVSRLALRNEKLKAELGARDARIAALERERRQLRTQIALLSESLRRFQTEHTGTLRANDSVVLERRQFEQFTAAMSNQAAILRESQTENARLRQQLGRGGNDLPSCPVTPGYLVAIDLVADGYLVRPSWQPDAAFAASRVSGIGALASSRRLSRGEFQRLAGQVRDWGRTQQPPCAFRATVRRQHRNFELYDQQRRLVAQYFYTPW